MVALMSVMASTPAAAKSSKNELKNNVPTNLIVKQTTLCFFPKLTDI